VLPTLEDSGLTLRPLREGEDAILAAHTLHPSLAEWWGTPDPPEREAEGMRNDGNAFAIARGDELIGWIAFHEEDEPDYRHVALDIMLAPDSQDQGLGPRALRIVIDWLIAERGHHRFTIDPSSGNARAIRAYAKAGFRPVGVLRASERAPDGTWRDGLLMDLLASELPD
jgi:aminoglycoside 6'-N-acetyltransferase